MTILANIAHARAVLDGIKKELRVTDWWSQQVYVLAQTRYDDFVTRGIEEGVL